VLTITDQNCKLDGIPYTVRWLLFDDGERFPILVSSANGQPLFHPTVYTIALLRGRGAASNTLLADLRAILHLYVWAALEKLDLERRLRSGEFLTIPEIESLTQAMRQPLRALLPERVCDERSGSRVPTTPFIERFRKRSPNGCGARVALNTTGMRLRYICAYLDWFTLDHLAVVKESDRSAYESGRKRMLDAIAARVPTSRVRPHEDARQGLAPDTLTKLLSVIDPTSTENPWKDDNVRTRNQLLIMMLLQLGIRRGEALGIRIEHIDLRQNTLLILRAADDPTDPRRHQPNTKTRDRKLPLSDDLADLIHHYITRVRNKVEGARYHSFLFASHDSGRPMSLTAFAKVFHTLRERVPDLPDDLCAHMCRHTWNDRFSELMDSLGTSEENEKKLRSYLMGWSEFSETAAGYTRRYTKRRATELSIKMQKRLTGEGKKDEHGGE
jgi:integrase